ncbi:MAG: hypothetical protein J6E32_03310 [Lachnospiraceae bacterium]|nr:hypothetical protein [Lachnospiraceae bacterium]
MSGSGILHADTECRCGSSRVSVYCPAKDVTITAGDGAYWIGGITGYAGGYEDESYGMPVTAVEDCTTSNVTVNAPDKAEGVDDFVGA